MFLGSIWIEGIKHTPNGSRTVTQMWTKELLQKVSCSNRKWSITKCERTRKHSRDDDSLLGSCVVLYGRSLPMFQRCLPPPSSGRSDDGASVYRNKVWHATRAVSSRFCRSRARTESAWGLRQAVQPLLTRAEKCTEYQEHLVQVLWSCLCTWWFRSVRRRVKEQELAFSSFFFYELNGLLINKCVISHFL
jgi:hypothetical protein